MHSSALAPRSSNPLFGASVGRVLLCVVQRASTATARSGGEVDAKARRELKGCCAEFARRGAAVALHVPRFGAAGEWYSVERQLAARLRGLRCFGDGDAPPPKRRRAAAPATGEK
eukprot:gene44393-64694_t